MGEFKQLLTLDGKTFIERCVDNLLAARVGEIVVVTGHRDKRFDAQLKIAQYDSRIMRITAKG